MIELTLWLWENKGDISFAAVIGVLLKHMWPYAKKRLHMDEVQEALQWAIPRIERLTGELYVTPTTRYSKQAQRRLKPLYRYLRMAISRGRTRARGNSIKLSGGRNMQVNMITIIIAILGAIKIVLQAFDLNIITDENINAIANGVSAVATIAGVFMSHRKPKEVQHPFEGSATVEKYQNTIGYNK